MQLPCLRIYENNIRWQITGSIRLCAGRQRYPVVVVSFEISSELSIGYFSHAVRWIQFLQVVQALILSETTLVVFR